MKKYTVTLSRVYEILANNESDAKTEALSEFQADLEDGFIVANEDCFSTKIKKDDEGTKHTNPGRI